MKIAVLFDTETTGLTQPSAADLSKQPYTTDIYMLKVKHHDDGRIEKIDSFETLVKPPIPLSAEITKITGLTDADLIHAPEFCEIYQEMAEFVKGTDRLVAHNLSFDRSVIAYELARIDKVLNFPWPIEHFCTVEKTLHIEQRRMSLTNLHIHLFEKDFSGAHRAKVDVLAMYDCYKACYARGIF